MKNAHKKYSTIVLLCVMALLLFWWYIHRPARFIFGDDRPLIAVALDSLNDYFKPGTKRNILEPEQWVEVQGLIKEINTRNSRQTIVLKGTLDASPYIICDMRSGQEKELRSLKENDTIKIKGVFKGFLKDAVFLNCMITYQDFHE